MILSCDLQHKLHILHYYSGASRVGETRAGTKSRVEKWTPTPMRGRVICFSTKNKKSKKKEKG